MTQEILARTLTAERLRDLLHYNPLTGVFTWRVTKSGKRAQGRQAGCIDISTGYIVIKLDCILYRAHRLASLWMEGKWPTHTVDHENRNRSDNRWKNLRHATYKQNQENLPLDPRNTSGYRGVHWDSADKTWIANIGHNGKRIELGRSTVLAEAIQMRIEGERRLFTHSDVCRPRPRRPRPVIE